MAIRKSERRAPKKQASVSRGSEPGARSRAPLLRGALLSGSTSHLRLAILAALAFIAIGAIAIQMLGDPSAAGPRQVVSLGGGDGAEAAPVVSFSEATSSGDGVPADLAAELAASRNGTANAGGPSETPSELRIAASLPRARPLPRAPIAGLTERGPLGPLPIVARDGRTPASVYARPFPADRRPKVALIVGGLGFNVRNTTQAIDELPSEVTLSFLPYARNLQSWVNRARARGHEVLLELPMEPFDPETDTGPQTLLVQASAARNVQRLENLLSRATGYFGVTNYQGARFTASAEASAPIAQQIKRRGLVFVTSGVGERSALAIEAARAGLPIAAADTIVDARREADSIDEQLLALEGVALRRGSAMGAAFAYPVTMEQIAAWASAARARGVTLAPASAIVQMRARPR